MADMAEKETTTTAIIKVLDGADGPMSASAIAEKVVEMVPGLKGKTPKATVGAKLYTQAKRSDGIVKKTAKGFTLRKPAAELLADLKPKARERQTQGRQEGESPVPDDIPSGEVIRDPAAEAASDGEGQGEQRDAKPDPKPAKRQRSTRGQKAAATS